MPNWWNEVVLVLLFGWLLSELITVVEWLIARRQPKRPKIIVRLACFVAGFLVLLPVFTADAHSVYQSTLSGLFRAVEVFLEKLNELPSPAALCIHCEASPAVHFDVSLVLWQSDFGDKPT